MTSKRLPGKVLKKIHKNFLAIDYVIKNILSSGVRENKIIIATPSSKKNYKLWKYIKENYNVIIFKGSEKNVFKRVFDCCKKYKIKKFVRFTSDNILVDPIFIKKTIKQFISSKKDYLASNTLNHTKTWKKKSEYNEGSSLEILNSRLLQRVQKFVNKKNYEYPTWQIFSNPKKFKIDKIKLISEYKGHDIKKFRTTVDTKEDLKFLRTICKRLNLTPGRNNFLKLIKKNKIIEPFLAINKKVKKKLAYQVVNSN